MKKVTFENNDLFICVSETNADISNNEKQDISTAINNYIPKLTSKNGIQKLSTTFEDISSGIKVFQQFKCD